MRHTRQGYVLARQESAQEGKRPVPTTDTFPPKETSDSRKENAVEYATLGNTGFRVSKLCFGTMIRVLVAEPDTASRRLICSILQSEPDVKLQCVDNSQLISSIQECYPDLVIMNIRASETRRASD